MNDAPSLPTDTWLNTATDPLPAADKAVITFWRDTHPYARAAASRLQQLHEAYDTVPVIGVYTPHFPFEDAAYVADAVNRNNLSFPVAVDTGRRCWQRYGGIATPRHALVDDGVIRHEHIGDAGYDVLEQRLRRLLRRSDAELPPLVFDASPTTPQWYDPLTVYAGQDRQGAPDDLGELSADRRLHRFRFEGAWTREQDTAVFDGGEGAAFLRAAPPEMHAVLAPVSDPVTVTVTLDGAPVPRDHRGPDVVQDGGKTVVQVDGPGLYSIVTEKEAVADIALSADDPLRLHAATLT